MQENCLQKNQPGFEASQKTVLERTTRRPTEKEGYPLLFFPGHAEKTNNARQKS
jgi:hypothetical protein